MPLTVARGHVVLFVTIETQQNQPAARTQDARALDERLPRLLCIRQRVKHQHRVESGL